MTEKIETTAGTGAVRTAALILVLAPLMQILAMAHHPSVHTHEIAAVVSQLRALAGVSALVHGSLIALMYLTLVALLEFSMRRGLAHALVRCALIAYGAGVLLMTGAALVSGFITPRIALAVPALAPADPALIVQFASFATLFNQAFARCGAVLMSSGIALWSVDLLRGARGERALGLFGVLTGCGGAIAVATGALSLDVHGMALVTLLQAVWMIAVGALLLRGWRRG